MLLLLASSEGEVPSCHQLQPQPPSTGLGMGFWSPGSLSGHPEVMDQDALFGMFKHGQARGGEVRMAKKEVLRSENTSGPRSRILGLYLPQTRL